MIIRIHVDVLFCHPPFFINFSVAPFIHDPVYRIRSPGSILDSVPGWDDRLEKLGGANTAYWPNYPVQLPKNVSIFLYFRIRI